MECSITANGWWYEIGWECEVQAYRVTKHLLRATKFDKPLKPNCFIPRVIGCLF